MRKHGIAFPLFIFLFALSFSSAFIDQFHAPKIIAGACFILYLIFTEGPEKIFSSSLFIPAAGFLFITAASLAVKGKFAFAGGNYAAMIIVFFILLTISAISSETLKDNVRGGILFSLFFVSILAILQYYRISDPVRGFSSGFSRLPYATFGNRVYLADYILLTIPFAINLAIKKPLKGAAVLVPAIWALYLCRASRTIPGIFAMAAVFIIFFLKNKNRRNYAFAIAGFLIFFGFFLYPRINRIVEKSLHPRIGVWRVSREMFISNPVFGTGAGTFHYEYPRYREEFFRKEENLKYAASSHIRRARRAQSDFVQILAETGITGFMLIGWIFYLWFKKSGSDSGFGMPARAAIAAVLASGLVSFPFHTPAIPLTAAVIMGTAMSPKRKHDVRKSSATLKFILIGLGILLIFFKTAEQIFWEKGRKAFEMGDYLQAVELLETAESFSHLPGEIIYLRARAWDRIGFFYIAENEYSRALETERSSGIYLSRALALLKMNSFEEAEEYLEKAVFTTPRLELPYNILIDLHNETGRIERARYYEEMLKKIKGEK